MRHEAGLRHLAAVESCLMSRISRREFIETTGAGIVIARGVPLPAQETPPTGSRKTVKLTVKGVEHRAEIGDHWTLAEMPYREELDQRLAGLESNPRSGDGWDSVKSRIVRSKQDITPG